MSSGFRSPDDTRHCGESLRSHSDSDCRPCGSSLRPAMVVLCSRLASSVSWACWRSAGCFLRKPAIPFGSITAMPRPEQLLHTRVWRGGTDGQFQSYDVPRQESQTVLDVVTWIQRRVDPWLAYRFACRVGMCGSCAMMVNGVPRWTCRTHVAEVVDGDRLEIAPLVHLPIIRDLVTDMRAFFDKWSRAKGRFVGERTRRDELAVIKPATAERTAADAGIECIGCGVCYAACDVVGWRPDFLGPAALNRAWTLINDARDTAGRE